MAYHVQLFAGQPVRVGGNEIKISVEAKSTETVRERHRKAKTYASNGEVVFHTDLSSVSDPVGTDGQGRTHHDFLFPMREEEYRVALWATFDPDDEQAQAEIQSRRVYAVIPARRVVMAVSIDGLYDDDSSSFNVQVSMAEEGCAKTGHQGTIYVEGIGSKSFATLADGTCRRKFKVPVKFPHQQIFVQARDINGNESDRISVTLPEKKDKRAQLEVDADINEDRETRRFLTRIITRKDGERATRKVHIYSDTKLTIYDQGGGKLVSNERGAELEVENGLMKIYVLLLEDNIQAVVNFVLEDEDPVKTVEVVYVKYNYSHGVNNRS